MGHQAGWRCCSSLGFNGSQKTRRCKANSGGTDGSIRSHVSSLVCTHTHVRTLTHVSVHVCVHVCVCLLAGSSNDPNDSVRLVRNSWLRLRPTSSPPPKLLFFSLLHLLSPRAPHTHLLSCPPSPLIRAFAYFLPPLPLHKFSPFD